MALTGLACVGRAKATALGRAVAFDIDAIFPDLVGQPEMADLRRAVHGHDRPRSLRARSWLDSTPACLVPAIIGFDNFPAAPGRKLASSARPTAL